MTPWLTWGTELITGSKTGQSDPCLITKFREKLPSRYENWKLLKSLVRKNGGKGKSEVAAQAEDAKQGEEEENEEEVEDEDAAGKAENAGGTCGGFWVVFWQ